MSFSQRQADPRRPLAEFTFVALRRVVIVHASARTLARKVVDVVPALTDTTLGEKALQLAVSGNAASRSA